MKAVYTVGICKRVGANGGGALFELEAEIARLGQQYGEIPENASVVPAPLGSSFGFEVIWIGEVTR
jgi:hypothetical protein